MNTDEPWLEANKMYLLAQLALVRRELERHIRQGNGEDEQPLEAGAEGYRGDQALRALSAPAALDVLSDRFDLSPFERRVLLTCAGVELDSTFAELCARAQGEPLRGYATFSLALAALSGAHWGAASPDGPLRRHHLVEVSPNGPLMTAPLRIDERVLHYLAGVNHQDPRLMGCIVALGDPPKHLIPSHATVASRMRALWAESAELAVQLCTSDIEAAYDVVRCASAECGRRPYVIEGPKIPRTSMELEALLGIWQRESLLCEGALIVDASELPSQDHGRVRVILEAVRSPLVVVHRDPIRTLQRPLVRLDLPRPSAVEQRLLWRDGLGETAEGLNGRIDEVISQFHLDAKGIRAARAQMQALLATRSEGGAAGALWEACRLQARPQLDNLAQRIESRFAWDDIVLPEPQKGLLRAMQSQVRVRGMVYGRWGFAAKSTSGLGINALFAGPSGTGKTLAAEVLASELKLDLYRIDLSQVVSKYIGETEKNLRRVFDAAEGGGAVLLFDEADALFGRRTEVRDSHDRYANIEVSYLLQRMEAYQGLAILTTNMSDALDTAFLRRIRFVVHFPFPDAQAREAIWRRAFPKTTPTRGMRYRELARLSVSGGEIRNIALSAAFLAARSSGSGAEPAVEMHHLLEATRIECAKLQRPLTNSEVGAWT